MFFCTFNRARGFFLHLAPWLASALILLCPLSVSAETMVYTLIKPESLTDIRMTINTDLLTLAMEKTRAEYGDFQIEYAPVMNVARALEEIKKNTYPNFVLLTTFQNRFLDDGLDYVRFPVDLGVTGYRICFVSPEAKAAVAKVRTLDDLRKFTIGQGTGWADGEILRYNQFKVVDVPLYESLFRMVAANRINLFCRGIDELGPELKAHTDLRGLEYDKTLAIAYPLPRFFVTNKQNSRALQRFTKGLQIAYQDGSLRKIWFARYESALSFANLKQRKLFYLETPNIDRIDFNYKKYFFDPLK